MKKILMVILSMVFIMTLIPMTISAETTNLYDSAVDGALLYTVNFNGDEIFTPTVQSGSVVITIDPQNNNKAKIDTENDKYQNRWGGEIKGLPLGLNNAYTIRWSEIRENDVNGAIGVYLDNTYGAYGYVEQHKIMKGGSGIGSHAYVKYETVGITPKATLSDGTAQEYALEVNAQNKTIKLYLLDANSEWKLLDKSDVGEISSFDRENLGFYTYTYYANKPVTLEDVAVYKGMTISGEVIEYMEETTAPETTAPETTEKTTTAPETTKKVVTTDAGVTKDPSSSDGAKAEKKGCGGSGVIIGIVQAVAVIGGSVIVFAVKKKV